MPVILQQDGPLPAAAPRCALEVGGFPSGMVSENRHLSRWSTRDAGVKRRHLPSGVHACETILLMPRYPLIQFGSVLACCLLYACGPASSVSATEQQLVAACRGLVEQRAAFDERCSPEQNRPAAAQAAIESCVATVTALGSTLSVADVTACSAQVRQSACLASGYPSCTGYEAALIYPNHDRKGTLAPGADCFASAQCDSGHCSGSPSECGHCERQRAIGESCEEAWDVCPDDSACTDGTCQPLGLRAGETCAFSGSCQASLFCKAGVCAPLGEAGDSCDGAGCAQGYSCTDSKCVALAATGERCESANGCVTGVCRAGRCTEPVYGLAKGEDCSFGYCQADLVCDESTKRCKTFPFVPNGGTCLDFGAVTDQCDYRRSECNIICPAGETCPETGTCAALPKPGEHCSRLGRCEDGSVCVDFDPSDLSKGRCVKAGADGEACPCNTGLACIEGRCAVRAECEEMSAGG